MTHKNRTGSLKAMSKFANFSVMKIFKYLLAIGLNMLRAPR